MADAASTTDNGQPLTARQDVGRSLRRPREETVAVATHCHQLHSTCQAIKQSIRQPIKSPRICTATETAATSVTHRAIKHSIHQQHMPSYLLPGLSHLPLLSRTLHGRSFDN